MAQELLLDPGALKRQLNTLKKEGLIARRNNPADKRSTTVSLSPAGLASSRAARLLRGAFLRKTPRRLPDDRLSVALETLELLERRLRAMRGP